MHAKGSIGLIFVFIVVTVLGIVGIFYIAQAKTSIPQKSSAPSPTLQATSFSPTPMMTSAATQSAIVASVKEYRIGGMPQPGTQRSYVSESTVAGVTVRAISTSKTNIVAEAVTDVAGIARLPISPGRYYVYLVMPSTNTKSYMLKQLPHEGITSPDWQEVAVTANNVTSVKLGLSIAAP